MVALALIDIGYGNLGSVGLAFERLGLQPTVTADPQTIAAADRVVLPGVGAAGYAMERLNALDLAPVIKSLKQPFVGICLGMQLLFERSEEADTTTLGLIPGAVQVLEPAENLPVPHMGWSKLTVSDPAIGLADGDYVYFAHSFACPIVGATVATARHSRPVTAAVRHGNIWGAQFHPEKSAGPGRRFLEAFLNE